MSVNRQIPIAKMQDRFVETEVDGEIVLMNTENGRFYALDGSALAIWRTIDGCRTRDAIIAELAAEFDETPEGIASDIDDFLDLLREAGLVEERIAS